MKTTTRRSIVVMLIAAAAVAPPALAQPPAPPAHGGGEQSWNWDEQDAFWYTPQGAMIMPYEWFLRLEQASSQALFREDANLDRLRFLPNAASDRNPDGLPIGFVKDTQKLGRYEMIGITCAACHTARLELDGKTVQVEGGPALVDFQTFVADMVAALEATVGDGAKFERFAAAVVGSSRGDKAAALRRDLEETTKRLAERKKRNEAAPYGYGRVDALGNILNEVMSHDLGVPENQRTPDAPVSYPVIWDAHQHDFVQWNGAAPNAGPGPLLRNIGEVLGVFGYLKFEPRPHRLPVYRESSVDVVSLKALEGLLETLQSPPWPATFPAIDTARAAAGQRLYQSHCQGCHAPIKRDDPYRRVKAHMVAVSEVGTDPVAAEGFLARKGNTGVLKGTPVFLDPVGGFAETDSGANILRNAVFGVMLGQFHPGLPEIHATLKPPAGGGLGGRLERDWHALENAVKTQEETFKTFLAGVPPQLKTPMYKARPLNGVWASAPYLHNGSVPTLADMLQLPASRPKTFYVGSRAYDPVNVGLRSVERDGAVSCFSFDTSLRGNSNAGHPYGTSLKDAEKRQLIEYLKTL
jgi:mono/diheme cytochrome c family protein